MAAAATEESTMTFQTFTDEAYGEYASLTMDGEKGIRTLATAFLGDKLPLRDSGLLTRGIPSTDVTGGILREAHSIVAVRPTPRDEDTRYITHAPDGDIVLGTALITGGPFGKILGETFASEETNELVAAIQRIASRTTRGEEQTRCPNILHSKGLAKYTGNILSPSALLGVVARDAEASAAIRVAEIHPGFGELLLASTLTEAMTYRGLETDDDLLPERYEPKAGSIPPRDDLRGVLDVVAPPSDPERVVLTNDPAELGDEPYDVVVLRQPRDDSEIALAMGLVKPDGVLVVIPGETFKSPGSLTASVLSGPLPSMSNPEVIGIHTLTQEFVGAIVYRHTTTPATPTPEPEPVSKQISHDTIGGVPFLNAGKNRLPAILFAAIATAGTATDAIVLQAPREIITSGVGTYVTHVTGKHVYLVETAEDVNLLVQWLNTKGARTATDNELISSKTLPNMIRTTTNSIMTRRKRSKRGKYTRPNAIVTYGGCPMMIAAVAEAFPDATIHVVLPPRDRITHSAMNTLVQRGYGKLRFTTMTPGMSPKEAITTAMKSSGAQLVWNTSWGKYHLPRSSPISTSAAHITETAPPAATTNDLPSSKYVTFNTLLSPSSSSIKIPYNLISTSLFKMKDEKQYKNFQKYTDGIEETIGIVREYLSKENFVLRLYVDDTITTDDELFGNIMRMARDAGFVEIVEYNAPDFRDESGIGHISTFGTLVRMMPVFQFAHSGAGSTSPDEVGVVCIRDLDIKHTPGQSYDEFFRFLHNDAIQVLAYTNGYNPHHLSRVPRNHHKSVFGTGSVAFRTKLDPAMFDNFISEILDPESPLQTDIIQPSIAESRRGKSAEGAVYYGIDELLLNYIMLPNIPAEALVKVFFYDEPYYLIRKIHTRYIKYASEEQRDAEIRKSLWEIRRKTPEEITATVKRLVEVARSTMPAYEYEHNKDYDITRTYENVML